MSSRLGLGGQASLRRMADPLDTSLSFQIPTTGLGDDDLLEYDDSSFLKGADNIPPTPAPSSRFTLEPLTINDLTPRPPKPTHLSLNPSPQQIRSRSPPTGAERTPSRRKSSRIQARTAALPRVTQGDSVSQTPRGDRLDSLREQLDSLTEELGNVQEPPKPDSPKAPAASKQKLRRREGSTQRKESARPATVREGGIAKARPHSGVRRSLIPKSAAAPALAQATLHHTMSLPPIQSSPQQSDVADTIDNPEPSVGSEPSYNVVNELMAPRQNLEMHAPIIPEASTSQTPLGEPGLTNQVAGDVNVVAVQLSILPVVADHSPLSVSQHSPQKPNTSWELRSAELDKDAAVVSAVEFEATLRTSSKRPVSVVDSGEIEGARARKKSKLDPSAGPSPTLPSSSKPLTTAPLTKPAAQRKSIKRLSSSGPRSRSSLSRRKSNGKGRVSRTGSAKSGSARAEKEEEREGPGTGASRRLSSTDSLRRGDQNLTTGLSNPPQNFEGEPQAESTHGDQNRWEPVPAPAELTRATRSSSRAGSRSGSTNPKAKVNIVAATIPVGFRFTVDARLEARSRNVTVGDPDGVKAKRDASLNKGKGRAREPTAVRSTRARSAASTSRSKGGFSSTVHPVPDFKSLHASNSAELARKRQKVIQGSSLHPTVPVAPRFATDARLEERHKFDEKMKVKEQQEMEEREARRAQEEAEQEKEVRELRKRAVPKAHEVPEWYKDAPKKGK